MFDLLKKGVRTIKDKGIALCHRDQGYSANMRHTSLMMKSIKPEDLTEDIIKNLRQVQVEISMEEFLRRFFDMWYSDAELLTKLMGFETQLEYDAKENPDDEWLQQWTKDHQEYLEENLSSITILRKAKDGEELSLVEQFELLKTQVAFEKALKSASAEDTSTTEGASKPVVEDKTEPAAPEVPVVASTESGDPATPTSVEKTTQEETPVDQTDVTKSPAYLELVQKMQDMEKAANEKMAKAEAIIKAQEQIHKAAALEKATGLSYVAEDQREAVAEFLFKSGEDLVASLLVKAQEVIKGHEDALVAKDNEIAAIRKEFGVQEHGQDGTVVQQEGLAGQELLNKALEALKAEKAAKQS